MISVKKQFIYLFILLEKKDFFKDSLKSAFGEHVFKKKKKKKKERNMIN